MNQYVGRNLNERERHDMTKALLEIAIKRLGGKLEISETEFMETCMQPGLLEHSAGADGGLLIAIVERPQPKAKQDLKEFFDGKKT